MSDIFREVEEEVRREKLRALWDKYGGLVLALAVAIVIGVAGWRGWEWWQHRQAEAAGSG
ncbi:MAG: tetratricopeptide repeat protein, partial [Methylacidiphilales bacterium]|nr:tetratricopeptide repeat protein [Candidatus Methylacidiphilales bacterium]